METSRDEWWFAAGTAEVNTHFGESLTGFKNINFRDMTKGLVTGGWRPNYIKFQSESSLLAAVASDLTAKIHQHVLVTGIQNGICSVSFLLNVLT